MGILEWLEAFGSPLKFLGFLVDFFVGLVRDAVNAIKNSVVNFFQSFFDSIANAVNQHLLQPLQNATGPFYPIILAALGGAAIWVGLWILDNIRDLL